MNAKERQEAIASLKVICREIGCSGLSPDMCDNRPYLCGIIGKILAPSNTAYTRLPVGATQYDTGHPNPMFVHRESRTNGGG